MTVQELTSMLRDPRTPDADVRRALELAVLSSAEFPQPDGVVVDAPSRRVSVETLEPDAPAPPMRLPGATRVLYVLEGRIVHEEIGPPTDDGSGVEAWTVGVGQVVAVAPGRAHRTRAHPTGPAVVLDCRLADGAGTCAEALPETDAGPAPAVDDYYYEYDDCYRTVYAEGAESWESHEPNDALVAFLERHRGELGRRVIDLGCGEGRDSVYLASQGFDVTGVDVSRTALETARQRARALGLSVRFLERDVILLRGVPPGSFTLALNMGCLHMLSNPEHRRRHLRRVAEVLAPGAPFLVAHCRGAWLRGFYSVPDYARVGPAVPGRVIPRRIRLAGGAEKWVELPTTHFRERGEAELAAELRGAGFEVVRILSEDNEAFGDTAVLHARRPPERAA